MRGEEVCRTGADTYLIWAFADFELTAVVSKPDTGSGLVNLSLLIPTTQGQLVCVQRNKGYPPEVTKLVTAALADQGKVEYVQVRTLSENTARQR